MANYSLTTLAELDARLLERVGGEGTFWQPRERLRAINEALDVWQLLTGDYINSATVTAVSNSDVVSFATTDLVVIPLRVKASSTGPALVEGNIHDFDTGVYGWRSDSTGTPTEWFPLGVESFVVHPKPTTNTPLTVLCVSDNYHLSDGDTVNMGDEELARILDYAQWYLSFKEGIPEGMENSSPLRDLFLLAARKRNSRLRRSALYREFMGQQSGEGVPSREDGKEGGFR